ncbi:hypothetical protein NUACC21_35230 [Scytonema sp. NUACC21]
MTRVVVYFYNGRWVPIKYCFLKKAIALYYKTLFSGQEVLLFPPNLDPNNF